MRHDWIARVGAARWTGWRTTCGGVCGAEVLFALIAALGFSLGKNDDRWLPEILLGLVVPVGIIVYMLRFSKSYPSRVMHGEPADASAGREGGAGGQGGADRQGG
jgi:hypothetical protein